MAAPGALVADRYRLIRLLGSGGMGVVWEARDVRLDRPVAVKQLRPQPGLTEAEAAVANQRAMREARINASLQHPYAVAVFDVVEDDGRPCIVMELVPSVPLSQLQRELGALEPTEAARVGSQAASALAAAHRLGIVHRDVKPGNILIGDDGVARICDFGISRGVGDATLTMTGMITGTPAYLAPEVARGGDATAASDVFALGATLYAAVEGEPPFGSEGNAIAVLYRVTSGEMRPPERAGALTPVLLAMMSPDPANRPSMDDAAQALASVADGQRTTPATFPPAEPVPVTEPVADDTPLLPLAPPRTTEPTPAPAPAPAEPRTAPVAAVPPTSSRRRPVLVAAIVVVLVLAGIVAYALVRPHAQQPTTGSSATPTTSASPSSTPVPSLTGARTTAQLASAVSGYYALLPDDTDAAWELLTPAYQRSSGGRDSYDRFWNEFETVTVSDVRATVPDRVDATITYVRKSGDQRSTERRTFRLVESDGQLKINQSSLI